MQILATKARDHGIWKSPVGGCPTLLRQVAEEAVTRPPPGAGRQLLTLCTPGFIVLVLFARFIGVNTIRAGTGPGPGELSDWPGKRNQLAAMLRRTHAPLLRLGHAPSAVLAWKGKMCPARPPNHPRLLQILCINGAHAHVEASERLKSPPDEPRPCAVRQRTCSALQMHQCDCANVSGKTGSTHFIRSTYSAPAPRGEGIHRHGTTDCVSLGQCQIPGSAMGVCVAVAQVCQSFTSPAAVPRTSQVPALLSRHTNLATGPKCPSLLLQFHSSRVTRWKARGRTLDEGSREDHPKLSQDDADAFSFEGM
ncbi:hypothetical protein P4O66_008419 [Electrophorus voltai]|uniref:Uncharacterized protein n=1 Tax=Electrophorus voltai TaxID=2609070 RepID=A0AAD8ZFJ7_9TELE|nr:hypothetical protein P4O66_008419 [Electrophorus voltai]